MFDSRKADYLCHPPATTPTGNCDASIVVSVYRSERYLDRFLDNVRRFVDEVESTTELVVELVFVFNSPSAHERRAGRLLHDLECDRVHIRSVDVERETLYASWNRGVRLAAGEVLGFWNVDDCRFSSAVVEAVAGMRSSARLMYFPYVDDHRWRAWGFVPRRRCSLVPALEFDPEAFKRTFLLGPFFMFSRGLYDEVGPFDEQFSISGDLDWGLRALSQTSFTAGSHVAGVFLNEHRGLSVLGSDRLAAESSAICVRHGLTELVQPVDGSLFAEYDVGRIRVGSTWQTIPVPSGGRPAGSVRYCVGPAQESASAAQALEGAAESLAGLAASGMLDGCLTGWAVAAVRRHALLLARRHRAAVARKELEARLCRGDLRDARREFLRVRLAYLSAAKFVLATPVVMVSPPLYAAYLRRVRTRRAESSAAGDCP